MINAVFLKDNEFYYAFKISGHADYGFSGNDMYWLNVPVSIDDAATLCDSSSDIIDFFFDVDVNSSRWKNSIAECSIANGGC